MSGNVRYGAEADRWLNPEKLYPAVVDVVNEGLVEFLRDAHLYLSEYGEDGNEIMPTGFSLTMAVRDSEFEIELGLLNKLVWSHVKGEYDIPMSQEQADDTLDRAKRFRDLSSQAIKIAEALERTAAHVIE